MVVVWWWWYGDGGGGGGAADADAGGAGVAGSRTSSDSSELTHCLLMATLHIVRINTSEGGFTSLCLCREGMWSVRRR